MTLPISPNTIRLSDIRQEFQQINQSGPVKFSYLYAGKGFIPSGTIGYPNGQATPIPGSGKIRISNFHGATSNWLVDIKETQNFVVPQGVYKLDVLIIGGGGGGGAGCGNEGGGGGGAGGANFLKSLDVTPGQVFACLIGKGGPGVPYRVPGNIDTGQYDRQGNRLYATGNLNDILYTYRGESTWFGQYEAYGGGAGGSGLREAKLDSRYDDNIGGLYFWLSCTARNTQGTWGGSGGGSMGYDATKPGGGGQPPQGYAGYQGRQSGWYGAGGGGGAGGEAWGMHGAPGLDVYFNNQPYIYGVAAGGGSGIEKHTNYPGRGGSELAGQGADQHEADAWLHAAHNSGCGGGGGGDGRIIHTSASYQGASGHTLTKSGKGSNGGSGRIIIAVNGGLTVQPGARI